MKSDKWYKLALLWSYFNQGYSIASFPKWVAAVFGVGEVVNKNYFTVLIGAFIFGIFCIFVGWICFKSGFIEAMNEVGNRHNLFMKEVRNSKLFKEKDTQ